MTAPAIKAALHQRKATGAPGPRSMRELAAAVGVKPSVFSHYVHGRRSWPPETLAAVRAVLPEVP